LKPSVHEGDEGPHFEQLIAICILRVPSFVVHKMKKLRYELIPISWNNRSELGRIEEWVRTPVISNLWLKLQYICVFPEGMKKKEEKKD